MKTELDCVQMKHAIQQQILAETSGMTDSEKLAHYQRRAQQTGDLWEKLQAAPPPPLWVQLRRQPPSPTT